MTYIRLPLAQYPAALLPRGKHHIVQVLLVPSGSVRPPTSIDLESRWRYSGGDKEMLSGRPPTDVLPLLCLVPKGSR